jgi:hypothetical protein
VSLDCTHAIVDIYFLCKHIYVGFVCACMCASDKSYLVCSRNHTTVHTLKRTMQNPIHATRNIVQQIKCEGESWVKFNLPVGLLQSLQCGN